MSISIPNLARENADLIRNLLQYYEIHLHPSSTEDEELVRRAVFSVRNKSIQFEKFNAKTLTILGSVNDVRKAEISISFSTEQTTCTCPIAKCRHQLGMLLALYQYFDSVQDWAARWRAKKTEQLQLLEAERTPMSWKSLIVTTVKPLFSENRPVDLYLLASTLETAHTKLNKFSPIESEWKPLFHIYAELIILNEMWAHYLRFDSRFVSDYFPYNVKTRIKAIGNLLENRHLKSPLFAQEPFIDAIQEELRKLVFQLRGMADLRLDLYILIWEGFLNSPKRIDSELNAIEQLQTIETDLSPNVVQLFHLISKKESGNILEMMKNLSTKDIEYYTKVAKYATSINKTELAELILKPLLPHLHDFIQQDLQPMNRLGFTRELGQLFEQIELTEEEEISLYYSFGRFGLEPFSKSLIAKKRYHEWIALNTMNLSSIPYLEQIGLKEIVENEPAVALPIYHFYAMEELKQKSRANYKQAVRIWRSMKATAKKAGKLNYFHDYITNIQNQHKRLRALQEEIIKANLAP